MKNTYKLLAFLLLTSNFLFAQEEKEEHISKGQSTIYYEYYGISGSPFSLHYDRVIVKNLKSYINTSIGLGTYSDNYEKYFSIPFSINYTTSLKKHHFEAGIGITYSKIERKTDDKKVFNDFFFGPKFGYKFQAKGKIFIKLNLNIYKRTRKGKSPESSFDGLESLPYLAGLAVGYSF